MRTTIADVARAAGVSIATVSRVLNRKGVVDGDTRARVEAAVGDLNYTPNLAARHLGSGQSFMLGLVLPDIANPFFPQIAKGASDAAQQHGYTLVLANSDSSPETEAEAIHALIGRRVDGVLLAPAGLRSPGLQELIKVRLPVVVLDRPLSGLMVDTVMADNRAGGEEVARHLMEMGHRRLGYIAGPAGMASAEERRNGFVETAVAMGAEFRPEWIASGDFQLHAGFQAMQRVLAAADRPTAVACANDLMALGALRALRSCGLRAPDDMAVVGYDDIPLAEMTDPALTTVGQPTYRMGAAAVERLLTRIGLDATAIPPAETRLPVRLVIRESCGSGKRGQPSWL